jgi:hypothetical protein
MYHNDGMNNMKYRTTFSLDEDAIKRLHMLATRWHVSKAEVIRRALEIAEKVSEKKTNDPYHLLTSYHDEGGLAKEAAETYLQEVYEDRTEWRGT